MKSIKALLAMAGLLMVSTVSADNTLYKRYTWPTRLPPDWIRTTEVELPAGNSKVVVDINGIGIGKFDCVFVHPSTGLSIKQNNVPVCSVSTSYALTKPTNIIVKITNLSDQDSDVVIMVSSIK